jgi:hypothetical protein
MDNRAMRLRVGGPLATYAAGFRGVLAEQGYAPSSVSGQLQLMAQLSDWLATRGMGGSDLGPVVAEGFMRADALLATGSGGRRSDCPRCWSICGGSGWHRRWRRCRRLPGWDRG